MIRFNYGRAWATDGSFYTEVKSEVEKFLIGLFVDGKKDYTIVDSSGKTIALVQIDY